MLECYLDSVLTAVYIYVSRCWGRHSTASSIFKRVSGIPITGDHSKQDRILSAKIGKYIVFLCIS